MIFRAKKNNSVTAVYTSRKCQEKRRCNKTARKPKIKLEMQYPHICTHPTQQPQRAAAAAAPNASKTQRDTTMGCNTSSEAVPAGEVDAPVEVDAADIVIKKDAKPEVGDDDYVMVMQGYSFFRLCF